MNANEISAGTDGDDVIDPGFPERDEEEYLVDVEDVEEDPYADEDAESLLKNAIDSVAQARRAPLSASVLIARDELLGVLQAALDRLPDEIRRARWLLKEQEEYVAQRRREAESLLEEVRVQAERMVQRTEIVRQAQITADQLVEAAAEESRRLKYEAEDFCDQRLATFEIVLDRTLKTVQAGREKLQAVPTPIAPDPEGEEDSETAAFFDQDES